MSKRYDTPLKAGHAVWKLLEKVTNGGLDRSRVFEDWLDMILAAHLSLTDNLARGRFDAITENKMDGRFEQRYMAIVSRYTNNAPRGQRPIDYLAAAYGELLQATNDSRSDVLGEIYMGRITYGEHGQYFTPDHLAAMMAQLTGLDDGQSVLDPSCGSGVMLISAGNINPNLELYGCDLDERCAKMCTINMFLRGFHATIRNGNTLSDEVYTEWRTLPDGRVYEIDLRSQPKAEKPPTGQITLFAA